VKASLEILATEGSEGLTVQAVVDRAGSSVGSFYARFAGKDELIEYLGGRVWGEAAVRWDEALGSRDWSSLDLADLIGGSVRLLVEAGRSRAVYLRVLGRVPGAPVHAYAAFQSHVVAGVSRLLLERVAEMRHPDPEVAVPLGLRAVLGMLDLDDAEGVASLPVERIIEEATGLLRGYLLQDRAAEPPGQGSVEFFDIWDLE
jgi:AcrR family transcriptional regulator